MLSSMLNELVSPTIQRTVTVPPSSGMGERPEERDAHARRGEHRGTGDLDAQPEPPVEGSPSRPQAP